MGFNSAYKRLKDGRRTSRLYLPWFRRKERRMRRRRRRSSFTYLYVYCVIITCKVAL
jgi:hypothetical protein